MARERVRACVSARGTALAVVAVAFVAAACVPPPVSDPPPETPPATCQSGAPEETVATHAGGESVESAALPVVAVTEEADGDLDVVTYGADDFVEAAEFVDDLEAEPGTDVVSYEVDQPVSLLGATTNDPYAGSQWAYDNVSYEAAWNTATGSGVTIAVVDTGVRADHEDLSAKVEPGADFVTPGGGTGCADAHGHGTHVAGIAAASTDNGRGVAGAARGADILPVRVLDAYGSGYASDVAAGIIWAADNGADVINLSLGGPGYSTAMHNAVTYAVSKKVVVVAAAGNDASSTPSYPGGFAESLTIASTTSANQRSYFSNYGPHIDLSAPGSAIFSTWGQSSSSYATLSGTSMATPYAAAAAALVKDACGLGTTVAQVEQRLKSTADDLGAAGFDVYYGYGLVDPASAVGTC